MPERSPNQGCCRRRGDLAEWSVLAVVLVTVFIPGSSIVVQHGRGLALPHSFYLLLLLASSVVWSWLYLVRASS